MTVLSESVLARKSRSWRRLWRGAAVLGVVYLVAVVLPMAFEDRLVYAPTSAAEDWTPARGASFQDVKLHTADGTGLDAWWLPRDGASGAILCCHGKSGNLSDCGRLLLDLQKALGQSVLMVDYPGYGRSAGQPSEAGCYAAADAAYDWLTREKQVPAEQVTVYGESLGGGVAVDLASRRPLRALVLVKTFTSLPDVGQHLFPWVPAYWVMHNRFDSLNKIRLCHAPVFVVHGTADQLVPFGLGRRLFEAANGPKAFFPVEGADHNHLSHESFLARLRQFLAAHPAVPALTLRP
jgi:fermentation-respiration switch protein FrsA (DUF1100 family)